MLTSPSLPNAIQLFPKEICSRIPTVSFLLWPHPPWVTKKNLVYELPSPTHPIIILFNTNRRFMGTGSQAGQGNMSANWRASSFPPILKILFIPKSEIEILLLLYFPCTHIACGSHRPSRLVSCPPLLALPQHWTPEGNSS